MRLCLLHLNSHIVSGAGEKAQSPTAGLDNFFQLEIAAKDAIAKAE